MLELLAFARSRGFSLSIGVTATTLRYTLSTKDEIKSGSRHIAPNETAARHWPALEEMIRDAISVAVFKASC